LDSLGASPSVSQMQKTAGVAQILLLRHSFLFPSINGREAGWFDRTLWRPTQGAGKLLNRQVARFILIGGVSCADLLG
jgi:hypothetical protein